MDRSECNSKKRINNASIRELMSAISTFCTIFSLSSAHRLLKLLQVDSLRVHTVRTESLSNLSIPKRRATRNRTLFLFISGHIHNGVITDAILPFLVERFNFWLPLKPAKFIFRLRSLNAFLPLADGDND